MKKPVVGILSVLKEKADYPYDTVYKTVSLYVKRVEEMGCTPIVLVDVSKNSSVLDLCDAFLLPGGRKISADHFYAIEHCIEKNKPLLGICLGMQAMIYYDFLLDSDRKTGKADFIYERLQRKEEVILHPLEPTIHGGDLSSGKKDDSLENVLSSRHPISISQNSLFSLIYHQETLDVVSMHLYGVYQTKGIFKAAAFSQDGVVEAVFYHDSNFFIIGVQYHPELEDALLFEAFQKEIFKRR